MNQLKFDDLDCTKKCTSRNHGSVLSAAATKRAVSDAALASFFKCTCGNFSRIFDHDGRLLIHLLASRGRKKLIEWILKRHQNTCIAGTPYIDVKDKESGYTALHRSVFYGQIHVAVSLIQHGASQTLLDNEDLSPIDHALFDRPSRMELSHTAPCEVYAWGTNANYTCGTGSQHQRNIPELLTTFTKQNLFVKQVCLSKFHSMFVTLNGEVWACGHGEGGRLGVAKGSTCVLPVKLSLNEPCIEVAIARDHSLLLMQSGNVLSCGLNEFHQLGQVPHVPFSLGPRQVKLKAPSLKGVRAGRYHSVAFGDQAIYTWGLNGGQLGHDTESGKTISIPTKVVKFVFGSEDSHIKDVAVSDGATVIISNKGNIYLLSKYQCRRVVSKFHNIKHVEVAGGEVVGGDKLTDFQKQISILILTTDGQVLIWQDDINQITRCLFSINRPIVPVKTSFTKEAVLIVTKNGEAFHGNVIPAKLKIGNNKERASSPKNDDRLLISKMEFNKFIDRDYCFVIKLRRIPNIHRAVDISSDGKGNNFAVLQVTPTHGLLDLPQVTSSQMVEDMNNLLQQASEFDLLHDVIVEVENECFPSHKFILSSGSEHFAKLFQDDDFQKDMSFEKPRIKLENVRSIIFKQILQYLYTGKCELTTPGPCKIEIKRDLNTVDDNKLHSEVTAEYSENQNDEEISAYEVHKKVDKKKKQQNKTKKEIDNKFKTNNTLLDPVRLLQETAKRLSITNLYKILSQYYYENGYIMMKEADKKFKPQNFKFERQNHTDLWDASIKSSDGVVIKAHRCILAARLEYFSGMFAHSWSENSANSIISFPMPGSLLEPIIDFLYTDDCKKMEKCDDVEFLTNLLVISDQLFITRLREICEVTFSNLLTLKNVHEILQLASIYNCPQLKTCCMEYITLNLPTILENKSLESIGSDVLEGLTEYYCEYNPIMCTRTITPYMDAVQDEVVLNYAENFPVDFEEDQEEEVPDAEPSSSKKRKPRKSSHSESDRTRIRNESTSSPTPPSPSNVSRDKIEELPKTKTPTKDQRSNDWVKVIGGHEKTVLARLKAIESMKENEKLLEPKPDNYTKLVKSDRRNSDGPPSPIQSPTSKTSILASPSPSSRTIPEDAEFSPSDKNSPASLKITVVNAKLSQKQRKKLALESVEPISLADHLDRLNMKADRPSPIATPRTSEEIRNPWKKIEISPSNGTDRTADPIVFSEILQDERKQRENFTKMITKPLALTQIEDKAIDDLMKYYELRNGEEERIAVSRVPRDRIAAPQWINRAPKSLI